MTVSAGKKVSIEYTLRLEDQTLVDTNVGGPPLTYIQGAHQIIPGLEKGIEGMHVGETKTIVVPPEEGFGQVDKEAFLEVDKSQIPPEALRVGAQVQGQGPEGQVFTAQVSEIRDNTVVLDFNHPLAGKTLYFEIKVLGIENVPQENPLQ